MSKILTITRAELSIYDSKKSQDVGVIRRSWGDSFRAGVENVDTYGKEVGRRF
jgi:hypothetical protein